MSQAKYLFVCPVHGHCGSTPIGRASTPPSEPCPTCALPTEVWVGAAAQVEGARRDLRPEANIPRTRTHRTRRNRVSR
jgi:hypothetical protein